MKELIDQLEKQGFQEVFLTDKQHYDSFFYFCFNNVERRLYENIPVMYEELFGYENVKFKDIHRVYKLDVNWGNFIDSILVYIVEKIESVYVSLLGKDHLGNYAERAVKEIEDYRVNSITKGRFTMLEYVENNIDLRKSFGCKDVAKISHCKVYDLYIKSKESKYELELKNLKKKYHKS